ncbi:contactin-like [Mizuhopecten yessoensis]|uniref:Contactin n=1 Tax=Mizuhopecten yessoensis TaxID=6573 RepID=A0A210PVR8_MIZYE|nr:contactin-like [Mizuhopecten yessoensis]OWF40587.1 Contactin [Mizuhopecten yessoensis]
MLPLYLLALLLTGTDAASVFDCPSDWLTNDFTCYKFLFDPKVSYEEARASCAIMGSSLLSVGSLNEHNFINNWLQRNDFYRNVWYTSGLEETDSSNVYRWASDSSLISSSLQFWLANQDNVQGEVIVYKFDGVNYGWSKSVKDARNSYVCEISQEEAYRLVQEKRDFEYGQVVSDLDDIMFGPQMTMQPTSVIVVSRAITTVLECRAIGNPRPEFTWSKVVNSSEVKITSGADDRYTLTNGKLTIQKPDEDLDANEHYQCRIENKYGKIFSDPVSLGFGYLGDFSNVQDAPVYAFAYDGAVIKCSNIIYKPAAVFNWQRGERREYIFASTTPYTFISSNGQLYFSEVTRVDEGDYYCQITLTALSGIGLGTSQAPSKTSLVITLSIIDQAAKTDWGPVIQDDFIAVFPQPPLKGQDVRLECFAYGSAQNYIDMWYYSWSRDGQPMPETARFENFHRILVIMNARLEDQGNYTCLVRRGNKAADSKTLYLRLEAKPYFILPLQNQHVDVGGQLTWRCEANGYPSPVYQWYKNGVVLTNSQDGQLTITGNNLVIRSLDKVTHDGMYQCSATNVHGTSFSSAQLRVLAFPPSFAKYPVVEEFIGALNGNLTIVCKPEAAPKAVITWLKNGANLNLRVSSTETGDRVRLLPNGFLYMTQLTYGDNGLYTCVAENSLGKATSSGRLTIKQGTVITRGPIPVTKVVMNETAFLPCEASYDVNLDLVYEWKFNGHTLDLAVDVHYKIEVSSYLKGLYIQNVLFKHRGIYECVAKTPLNQAYASGSLEVLGPPGEPAGVFGDSKTVTAYSIRLHWFPGHDNGRTIIYNLIQSEMEYDPGVWRNEVENIPDIDTVVATTDNNDMHSYVVTGLRPGNGYRFRVQAVNTFGYGEFSIPSDIYQTNPAPPSVAPSNIRGGGGSVADLTMRWDKLHRIDHGGPGVGYYLYWRLFDPNPINDGVKYNHKIITDYTVEEYVMLVGENNFYLQYEVKIQAFNDYGRGPNSSVVLVFSAEGMPIAAPQGLYCDGYNATAMTVTWETVPDTRETMKGRVRGYQINYWFSEDTDPVYKLYIRYPGQVDEAVVIGLWDDSNFWFEVQVYNTAGLGPLSEKFIQETLHLAPQLYPQEVHVFSHGSNSVRLQWRGVSTAVEEAVLLGYYIYLWPANEHYRTAKMIETEKFDVEFVLNDIDKGKVYAVRVAGFSDGGEGKKSPTLYFTLGGQVPIDPTVSEIRAGAPPSGSSILLLLVVSLALMFL